MKIVAILRIKNEILVINKCLAKLSELVDEIIVLDNGSTDGTQNVYVNFPKITKILHTEGYDEGRDKVMLLDEARKTNPDWILWIDGDEVLRGFVLMVQTTYIHFIHKEVCGAILSPHILLTQKCTTGTFKALQEKHIFLHIA